MYVCIYSQSTFLTESKSIQSTFRGLLRVKHVLFECLQFLIVHHVFLHTLKVKGQQLLHRDSEEYTQINAFCTQVADSQVSVMKIFFVYLVGRLIFIMPF